MTAEQLEAAREAANQGYVQVTCPGCGDGFQVEPDCDHEPCPDEACYGELTSPLEGILF